MQEIHRVTKDGDFYRIELKRQVHDIDGNLVTIPDGVKLVSETQIQEEITAHQTRMADCERMVAELQTYMEEIRKISQ